MPTLATKEYCTGCTACASVCPQGCIEMKADEKGFLSPVIDEEVCISCCLCEKSCPIISPLKAAAENEPKAYATYTKNETIRQHSSSGGIFTEIAKEVLHRGGVVFGAAYNEQFKVIHICVENEKDLAKLRGSKYAQSDLCGVFVQIKHKLEKGQAVLFVGTPCQIAGLQTFLGQSYENLICVDLICHGIPSPEVWRHYVDYRTGIDNNGELPISINMRSKITGWQRYSVEFQYVDKKYSTVYTDDPYMYGYIKDLYTRSSCFECKFKGINRTSDFTIADYWGIEGQHPEMNDGLGTSLVFVHSKKATVMWNAIADALKFKEVNPESSIEWNPMAVQSIQYQEKREEFFNRYFQENFDKLIWELVPKAIPPKTGLMARVKNKIRRIIING